MKLRKEKFEVSGSNSSADLSKEVNTALTENERFVKKLEIQIDIIKKIIDPDNKSSLGSLNSKPSLKEKH